MKALLPLLLLLCIASGAAVSTAADRVVVERGPNHKTWERIERQRDGTQRRIRYVELSSGMHYANERGELVDSKEEIEVFQGAAVARQGPHKVVFAANLNSPGAIDMVTPDGKRFRSTILGLAYTDYASGRSVMIAEITDCAGAVLPPNQVLYRSALRGDCLADVLYTYTKSAFEQDVIWLTAPPPPEAYGLNSATTRAEVWTEFVEIPEGTMTPVVLKRENDPIARQQRVEPDLIDQRLDFGIMKFEEGHAFPMDQGDPFNGQSLRTGKSVERIDGRVFLIEKLDYADIREHLQQLPQQAAARPRRQPVDGMNGGATGRAMFARTMPVPKGTPGEWKEKQYARVEPNRKGFVWDYVAINGSLTNYVLQGTVHVTGAANLYGTTVLRGGTVIKGAGIALRGPLDCRTSSYRPATWTATNDNTIGEIINGSNGSPSGYHGTMLNLYDTSAIYDLHNFRMAYGTYGVILNLGVKADLSHFQIGKSQNAVGMIAGTSAHCRNYLFYDLERWAFPLNGAVTNRSEHATLHRVGYFRQTTNASSPFTLTNSMLIAVSNHVVFEGTHNVVSSDDTGVFQTVGSSAHYPISGSTNRNAGTTNIHPGLLAALKTKTTWPPMVLTNNITSDTILTPQAQRDTDQIDLGYHFDPLDFVFSGITLSNATLTVQPGVAIGTRTLGSYGLGLLSGARFICEGTPENLNRIVRYNTVQEQANTNWTEYASGGGQMLTAWSSATTAPHARVRFTEFSVPAGTELYHFRGMNEDAGTHDVRDCQFHEGVFLSDRPTFGVTNCLFNRTRIELAETYDMNPTFRHCTFVGSDLTLAHAGSGTWTFQNNLFDGTTNSYVEGTITHNYNAYTTNATRLTPTNVTDLRLSVTNIVYDTGPLGRFYLSTNLTSHSTLFDAGSAAAHTLGFFHFTAVSNQTRELTGVIDFGFHSVAVNASGQPLDADSDGLPDYSEDANGNGDDDGVETNWEGYNSISGLTGSPGLQVFTPLK